MASLSYLLVIDYKLDYLGGAQTAFLQQALALASAGNRVTVLAPGATEAESILGAAGVQTVDVAARFVLPGLDLPLIRNTEALRRRIGTYIRRLHVDAVIVHSDFGLAAAALAAARDEGTVGLHTVHSFFWRGSRAAALATPVIAPIHRFITQLPAPRVKLAQRRIDSALRGMTLAIARTADAVISPSRHQAVALRTAGLPAVHVVSNTTAQAPAFSPLDSGPLQLVWAGRFAPEKRLDVAVAAMRLVEQGLGRAAVTLHVLGGTPSRSALRQTPDNVRYHGRITNPEVSAMFGRSHAGLITSLGFDNQPMVAIEAFRTGRPVIVCDPILADEFGDAAIAADDPSAGGLAATIVDLAHDRARLARAAAAAERLSRASLYEGHAELIAEIVGRITSERHSPPAHRLSERPVE